VRTQARVNRIQNDCRNESVYTFGFWTERISIAVARVSKEARSMLDNTLIVCRTDGWSNDVGVCYGKRGEPESYFESLFMLTPRRVLKYDTIPIRVFERAT
jgi:hypothetical protein